MSEKKPLKFNWKKFGWLFIVIAVLTVLWIIFRKVIANYIRIGVVRIGSTDRIEMLDTLKRSLKNNVLLRIFTWRKINEDGKKKKDSEKTIEDIFNKYSNR